MKTVNTLLSAAVAGALFSSQAVIADDHSMTSAELSDKAENTWLTMSGEIAKVDKDTFTLHTGDRKVDVEFGDGDLDADAAVFDKGTTVTVTGKVDKNFFSDDEIEASSVFVHDWHTTYVSNPTDIDARDRFIATAVEPTNLDDMTVIGTVSNVKEDVIEVATGDVVIDIDTSELPGQPLDEEGFLHIQQGDRVKVDATIESAFFNESMVVANTVIRLNDVGDNDA